MRGCLSVLIVLLLAAFAAAGDCYAPSYRPAYARSPYYSSGGGYGYGGYQRPTLYRTQRQLFRVWFRAQACDPWQLAGRFAYQGDAQNVVSQLESSGYEVAVN